MSSALPASVYSPDHLRFVVEELERYVSTLLTLNRGGQGVTLPELSPESLAVIAAGLEPAQASDAQAIMRLTVDLAHKLNTAVTMAVTLAALAPHALKEEMVAWLRENVSPDILVEFHVDPDIAGGMVLRSLNRVYDDSFRVHLLEKPRRFTEILTSV